jgi:hypothetical protein
LVEGWGIIRNARVGSDGAYGDLHYLTKHPSTPWLLERIERQMQIGLSHNARGKSRLAGGREIIESVPVVFSIDLVSRSATTTSLFESEESLTEDSQQTVDIIKLVTQSLNELLSEALAKPVSNAPQQRKESIMVVKTKRLPGTNRSLLRQRRPERSLVEMAIDRNGDEDVTDDIEREWGGEKNAKPALDDIRKVLDESKLTSAQKLNVIDDKLKAIRGVAGEKEREKENSQSKPDGKAVTESVALPSSGGVRTTRRVPRLINNRS